MEHSRASYGRNKGMSMGNIIGDPFALATSSIAALAWIITFISCIIAQVQAPKGNGFPQFSWWSAIYMLFVVAGVICAIAADAVQTYHVALVGYLACGLVLATSSVNALVYSPIAAREAAAAGFILLSMVSVSSSQSSVPINSSSLPQMLTRPASDCMDLLLRLSPICDPTRLP
jgi:SHO1 osmosensor